MTESLDCNLQKSDWELVDEIHGGDPEAFGKLYERYAQTIFRYHRYRQEYRFTTEEAEDLTHDTFERAFRGINTLCRRDDVDSARGWFFKVARRTFLNELRKRSSRPKSVLISANPAVEDTESTFGNPHQAYESGQVLEVLADLPGTYGLVLALKYEEGLRDWEIGQVINKDERATKSTRNRAVEAFKRRMIDKGLQDAS